jgi:glycerol-3-phosphate O-acyltransferase / dihydroxyacetone phosphate acyltransferase
MRRLADRGMANFARLLIHIFFREVELECGVNLPQSGPVVVVANHINGLVDGLLLMATLSRYPRFLGKSTLFKIIPLWPFLKFAGVVPVYRAADGGRGGQNVSAFATCHEILAAGGLVALFPEGISHDKSSLQPLKTGAARIALGAGIEGEVEGVVTIAVGLTYDAKARFRSRALVRIGTPAEISQWTDTYQRDDHQAVREFTVDIADRLATVSPGYASWDQAEQLSRIAEIVVRQPLGSVSPVSLADRVAVAQRLGGVAQSHPGDTRLAELLTAMASYERDLDLLGLSDSQLATDYRPGRVHASFVWAMLSIVAAVPFALVGVVVHVIPFQIVKRLATVPASEGMKATVKLLGSFASFTLVYAALGFFVGRAFGAWAVGVVASVGAPLCGYVTVRLAERAQRMGGVIEGYRTVREHRADLKTVQDERSVVVGIAQSVLASA